MAIDALDITTRISGSGTLGGDSDLSNNADSIKIGDNGFPELKTDFAFGTGSGQANNWFADKRTLAASANDDLDLAGGLTNWLGDTLTFTAIKFLLVAIDTPDGSKSLRVGPQGVSNAWQGIWGGTAAGNYITVKTKFQIDEQVTGLGTITAGTGDILRIHNPGGTSVDYYIWLVGVTS